jgi:ubiquinone/menaquinone biosynthesis C-methylase UbiE
MLNQAPPEVVAAMIDGLEDAGTLPAFKEARQALFRELRLSPQSGVFEGGCGTGAALRDLIEVMGHAAHVTGIDPTTAFVERARERARQLGAVNATYDIGDFRAIQAADCTFDAAFCDKVLEHAGPAVVALREMARVVKQGGSVGALAWMGLQSFSSSYPELVARHNAALQQGAYGLFVATNLARLFKAAGLADVRTRAFLAQTDSLEAHPFWRSYVRFSLQARLREDAAKVIEDIELLNQRGEFQAHFVINIAVGTKPAQAA